MRYSHASALLLIAIGLLGISYIIYQQIQPKPKNTIVRYEDFRGCKVPILADGQGNEVMFVGNVPWDRFSIQEKMRMAAEGGGYLSEEEIVEIIDKFGAQNKGN